MRRQIAESIWELQTTLPESLPAPFVGAHYAAMAAGGGKVLEIPIESYPDAPWLAAATLVHMSLEHDVEILMSHRERAAWAWRSVRTDPIGKQVSAYSHVASTLAALEETFCIRERFIGAADIHSEVELGVVDHAEALAKFAQQLNVTYRAKLVATACCVIGKPTTLADRSIFGVKDQQEQFGEIFVSIFFDSLDAEEQQRLEQEMLGKLSGLVGSDRQVEQAAYKTWVTLTRVTAPERRSKTPEEC
jgi:hypothetical protein